MKIIKSKNAPAAVGPYSQAIESEKFLFCSGQLGIDPETGEFVDNTVEGQTEQIIKNIEGILGEEGLSLHDVVKTTVFLRDMGDFSLFNGVYERCFGDHKPARSTIGVAALPLNGLVEIECIAIVGNK